MNSVAQVKIISKCFKTQNKARNEEKQQNVVTCRVTQRVADNT